MKTGNKKYFNFPVPILAGYLDNRVGILRNVLTYACYDYSCKQRSGTQQERMVAAYNYFNIEQGNVDFHLDLGKKLHELYRGPLPMVGIETSIFWEYYKNEKSEIDDVCLLAYLAIRSILGNKAYCKMDNKFMLSRMSGNIKSCEFSSLPDNLAKYANEYQTKKIKNLLILDWSLVHYSRHTRGFYVSFGMDLQSLIYEAEVKRLSNRIEQQKQMEKEALIAVRESLKVTTI